MKRDIVLVTGLAIALLLAGCGGGGGHHGGGGGGGSGGGANPVPGIAGVMPNNGLTADASSNAQPQTLTINGSGFIATSAVSWNGTSLAGVAFVNNSQLTVPVPASDLAASGSAVVVVTNPAPGGGSSNPTQVNINPPALSAAGPALAPSTASALSGGFQVTVTASDVLQNSVVVWNAGSPNVVYLHTELTTPPASSGDNGTLTAVVPNYLIAAAGAVPVAVANPDANGNISALSGNTSFTVSAPVTPACLLAGAGVGAPQYRNYAFEAGGVDSNGAVSMIGSFRIDATGALVNTPLPNIVNSFADFKDPKNLFAVNNTGTLGRLSGAAGSCQDTLGVPGVGAVQFTVSGISDDTFTLAYALDQSGALGQITLTDSLYGLKATGDIHIQYVPNAFNQGSFAFGLTGANAAASPYAVIGAMCTSSPVFLQADFDDNGTPQTATASGWSLNNGDATTGRTTTTELSFTNGRILNLTLYGVGGRQAYVMESSPVASSAQVLSGAMTGTKGPVCLPTGVGGSFSNASLYISIFGVGSQGAGAGLAALGLVTGILPQGGGSCAAGQGYATLNEDVNAAGTLETIPQTPACYQISPAGRGVLTFTDPNTQKMEGGTFYLDGQGIGYLIGGGAAIPYGFVVAVVSPGPPSGVYAFAPLDFPGRLLNVTSLTLNSVAGTITDNAPGGSSGTYICCDGYDRGSATLNNANTFGDTQLILYQESTSLIFVMDASSPTPALGVLFQ